jgi:hypothetical protein
MLSLDSGAAGARRGKGDNFTLEHAGRSRIKPGWPPMAGSNFDM